MAGSFLAYSTLAVLLLVGSSSAQLSTTFYSKSCPKLLCTVKSSVQSAISKERRMGASLLRLHFHDCFVNGCDGSILLDDTTSFTGEKTALPNRNSARGFDVIDDIKSAVEKVCPGVVSCADILTIATRDSVAALGGPSWDVKLGRRDARTASLSAANNNIPPPTSSLSNLVSKFSAQGLSAKEMVALSGRTKTKNLLLLPFLSISLTQALIGRQAPTPLDKHAAPPSELVFTTRATLTDPSPPQDDQTAQRTSGSGDNNLGPLDLQTPTGFDNNYYKNLVNKKGLLHSDQVLFNGGSSDSQVRSYSTNPSSFNVDFVAAMIKMGNIKPLTGSKGEIRKNCRRLN